MRSVNTFPAVFLLISGSLVLAQDSTPTAQSLHRPLYRVTIVSRTTKAVNYGHRTAPTEIDFAGTPLLADAKGKAIVEAKQGSTVINVRFSKVPPPTRFGSEYLTYVVWAISPDGRAQNLGELVLDGSDKGKLTASTSLQTFAMIVTAEPHFSVPQPSDVVVMENIVSPLTVGKVEEVNATYELLPRKGYTYDPQVTPARTSGGKPVSRDEYDAILALYQAQNAIQMAEADGAGRYAAERLGRARQLYEQARGYPKGQGKDGVAVAREATQVAEDARRIALKRVDADRIDKEEQRVLELKRQAEAQAQQARAAAEEGQRARTEREPTSFAQPPEAPPPPVAPPREAAAREPVPADPMRVEARENRSRLVSRLQNSFETIDSARGVVITLSPSIAYDSALSDTARRIAGAVRSFPSLQVDVEAHSDREEDSEVTQEQADQVKRALAAAGIPANMITAHGFGNSRPRGPSPALGGGLQNRRIEVVIAGNSIGNIATWDRTYAIEPSRSAQ